MSFTRIELKANRLSIFFIICFSILFLNLFRMQILRGDYYRGLSEKNRLRVVYLEGARGKILDRNGKEIATSRLSFNCTAVPGQAKETIHESILVIASILGEDAEKLEKLYHRKKAGVFNSVLLAEDIPAKAAMAIEEMVDTMPGVMIETRPIREYPYGEASSHITGYLGPMTDAEKEDLAEEDYRSTEWIGRDGIERFYQSYLKGRSGGIQMEVNSRGRFLRALGVREPAEGKDLQLTLDAGLQVYVQKLIQSEKAAVVVMELEEGGILSMNSAPSYNANLLSSSRGRRDVGKYFTDPDSPMVNRAIAAQCPPGSIFKMVTALAGLESKKIRELTTYSCPGYLMVGGNRFGCWTHQGHGVQNLTQALAHSCDVYFYLTGLATGADAIYAKALEFGFFKKTGIDLPGEKEGLVPSKEWKRKRKGQEWFDGDTANTSIGQGFLLVTPIQALSMVSALADGSEVLRPHLVDKIGGVKIGERRGSSISITPKYLKAVKVGMRAVVNDDTGTGKFARAEGVSIAGKTGTAESGQHETHAWFVGYAPEDRPKVAVVVFVENGGHGGVAAAKVASKVFEYLKGAGYL